MKRTSYQKGTVTGKPRKLGPDVWVFRYMDGGIQRSKRIGTVDKFPTRAAAEKKAAKLREEINDRIACIKIHVGVGIRLRASVLCDRCSDFQSRLSERARETVTGDAAYELRHYLPGGRVLSHPLTGPIAGKNRLPRQNPPSTKILRPIPPPTWLVFAPLKVRMSPDDSHSRESTTPNFRFANMCFAASLLRT